MTHSEPSEQINDNEESFYDENAIQTLKQLVCLNNHQLLELTYNDQKFYEKLKELNHNGCIHIQKLQYTEALIYLTEAQKVLQYAASCGKTIERKLIITTLNNEASLYQKAWELQKAESYLEAIIYNISSFFENSSENQHADKNSQFTHHIFDKKSPEYQDFSISLWRKKSLVIFYLQYCAINSQNKNNQRAFSSASKAVSLIKEISMDFHRYEQFCFQNKVQIQQKGNVFENDFNSKDLLLQLACFKQIDFKRVDFEEFYKKTVKYIAAYMKRLHTIKQDGEEKLQSYKKCFQNYSIGTIMQINPIELDQQTDKVDLEVQISMIQKHYKAIYLSVGHFILGTEARFIAAEKYTLDQNERKNSPEYKESQIYHLCSIIILTKFLLCESGYFDHIVNSFRNHYKLDILQDARRLLEQNLALQTFDLQKDQIFEAQSPQETSHHQVEQIHEFQSDIKSVQQITPISGASPVQNVPLLNVETQSSQSDNEGPVTPKQKNSRNTKSTKLSKNTVNSQNIANRQRHVSKQPNTATKKSQKKYNNNPLTKSQNRLQTQQVNRMTGSQHEHKNLQKAINLLTSREKQNKIKSNQQNHNAKSSRSKKKSEHQFMVSHKKIQLNNDKNGQKTIDRNDSRKQTIYSKRQSDYGTTALSRSKQKRIPTSNDLETRLNRRKDSFAELKKAKKADNEYGIGASSRNLQNNKNQSKNRKDALNNNIKGIKRPKNLMQSAQKPIKMTSPQVKLKKLKSPRNIKK